MSGSGSAMPTAEDLRLAAEVSRGQDHLSGSMRRAWAEALAEAAAGLSTEEAIKLIGRTVGELTEDAIRLVLARVGV